MDRTAKSLTDVSTGLWLGRRPTLAYALLFLTVLLIATLPLWFAKVPPLNDYPFHLARIHILQHIDDTPFLGEVYERRSFLLPNMAMDLVVLGLSSIMPLEVAGRVFLGLTLALILGGTAWLHYAITRRLDPWPLVAALFLHNWIYLFGFLNFLFGFGVALWALGSWLMVHRRGPVWRLTVGTFFALLLFWSHMVALAVYAIAMGAIELQRAFSARQRPLAALADLVIAGITLLPPAILFLTSATSGAAGGVIFYQPYWWWKPFVLARTFMSGNLYIDAATFVVALALAVLLIRWARVWVIREMRLALVLMFLAFLATPFALFSAQHVDVRIPMVLWFLAIASLQVSFPNRRHAMVLAACVLVLMTGRMIAIAADWSRFDKQYAQFTRAFAELPPGSTLAVAVVPNEAHNVQEWIDHWRPQITHISALAVLNRPVFVTTIWAHPAQQPIVVKPAYRRQYRYQDNNPVPIKSVSALEHFANVLTEIAGAPSSRLYVLLLNPQSIAMSPPTWRQVAKGDKFVILEVAPGADQRATATDGKSEPAPQ